jgi:hypothetical protein
MSRTRSRMAEVNSGVSRAAHGTRGTVPLLGVASRFGSARAHRTSSSLATSVPLHVAQHARYVGAGCPSCGGQRTVWFVSKKRCARLCSTAILSLRSGSKTSSQQPGVRSVAPRSRASLALRVRAAPSRWGRAGTGFARAASAGAFGQRTRQRLWHAMQLVPPTAGSNPSFKRTHNGGPRLLAPSSLAAPLCAA